jgi:hypothetical protein
MQEVSRLRFSRKGTRSLAWMGDDLVDWVDGGARFHPDGSITERRVNNAFAFDRAIVSASVTYAVIYTELGTKGLVLRDGAIFREINRSFYCAGAYEYPVALGRLPDGREVLAHCPDDYDTLQIEEVESGKRLTERSVRRRGFFHSRLLISSDGHFLLSAGWIWHPVDELLIYDLAEALRRPETLDGPGVLDPTMFNVGVASAEFAGPDRVLIAACTDDEPFDPEADERPLGHGEIGTWSLRDSRWETRTRLDAPAGLLLPLGDAALSLYEHPKLVDLRTGAITAQWPDLRTGRQMSSITWRLQDDRTPPLAVDSARLRFALADDAGVTVIQVGSTSPLRG